MAGRKHGPRNLRPRQRDEHVRAMGWLAVLVVVGAVAMVFIASSCGAATDSIESPTAQLPTSAPTVVAPTSTPTAVVPTSTPTAVAPTSTPVPIATNPPPQAPVAPTSAPAIGGAGCYVNPEGNCYRAGEFCPNAMHGQTIQGASGQLKCEDVNGWRWESV